MISLISRALHPKFFYIILKKIIKKFEKDTSIEATNFAISKTKYTTQEFCELIDRQLYLNIQDEVKSIEKESSKKLSKLNFSLGGSGNYILLYFLVRKLKPNIIIETGVAAGWSSLAILRALNVNGHGKLYSSDLPYFKIKNSDQYIGYLAKNELNKFNWILDKRGDDKALPDFLNQIGNNNIDIVHYDSDKSYSGRKKAYEILKNNFSKNTIFIFDDIQNNVYFKDLVESTKQEYFVLEFKGKYLGILGASYLFD